MEILWVLTTKIIYYPMSLLFSHPFTVFFPSFIPSNHYCLPVDDFHMWNISSTSPQKCMNIIPNASSYLSFTLSHKVILMSHNFPSLLAFKSFTHCLLISNH